MSTARELAFAGHSRLMYSACVDDDLGMDPDLVFVENVLKSVSEVIRNLNDRGDGSSAG